MKPDVGLMFELGGTEGGILEAYEIFWSYIPDLAMISYTSNLPQNGIGNYS